MSIEHASVRKEGAQFPVFKITDVNSLFPSLNYYTYFRIIIIDCIIIIII